MRIGNSKLQTQDVKFTLPHLPGKPREQGSSFILFVVALSLALNLHALAADSFWGDEIFTAIFAGQAPAAVIHWTADDIHPPLYYLLAGHFTRLTLPLGLTSDPSPISDWLWRFPSVIAVVLTVAVTSKLAYHVSSVPYRDPSFRRQTARMIRDCHGRDKRFVTGITLSSRWTVRP